MSFDDVATSRLDAGEETEGRSGMTEEGMAGMENFRCLRLSALVRATRRIQLPAYQGGTLRGSFGHALKGISCAMPGRPCESCLLKSTCVYSYAFETPPPSDSRMLRKYPYAPHPFVLDCQTTGEGTYEPGETFSFGLTLVGRAAEYLPYFVYAVMRMGETGVGRGRGSYRVERVVALDGGGRKGPVVYENEVLEPPGDLLRWDDALRLAEPLPSDRLALRFLTPLRVKYQGSLCDDPQFHVVVRNLLRRLSSLSYFHCGERLDLPFADLIRGAEGVRMVEGRVRWHDWTRYSGRQKGTMKMGGVLGEAVYEGDLEPFLPLLAAGSWVHVGKGTSFGLGKLGLGEISKR